jgi:hypothetical protein
MSSASDREGGTPFFFCSPMDLTSFQLSHSPLKPNLHRCQTSEIYSPSLAPCSAIKAGWTLVEIEAGIGVTVHNPRRERPNSQEYRDTDAGCSHDESQAIIDIEIRKHIKIVRAVMKLAIL